MADQTQTWEPWRKTADEFWAGMKELKEQMKETDRKIGRLGNRFGELAEHLVSPGIKDKFNARGFHFDDVSLNRDIEGPDGEAAEIDVFLENAEFSIVVEVKSRPMEEDIRDHIKRMEIVRRHKDRHHDSRKLQGAIAGAIMSPAVRNFALKKGFYVIEQSGDTMMINVPDDFKPREW